MRRNLLLGTAACLALWLPSCTSGSSGRTLATTSGAARSPSGSPFLSVSDRVPWLFPVPNGWTVSVGRSAPDPNLMTGVLQTWATNAPYRFTFGHSPSPNGTGGASETLGSETAVVKVQLLWFPPEQDPTWAPSNSAAQVAPASGWHGDAQNPGWVFRERTASRGQP